MKISNFSTSSAALSIVSLCNFVNLGAVQFSRSVVSDSLRPHESQHARPTCPSPTPRVHSDSRPSSPWCHPAISFSVVPFSSCPQSLPALVFSNESTLRMRWPKYWSFSLSISPFDELCSVQFSSVQSLSHVRLFATPWIAARQASLSITNSRSSLRFLSIESVMPSSHLILGRPLLLLPPIPPSISLFQWVNSSHEVAKVLEFQL